MFGECNMLKSDKAGKVFKKTICFEKVKKQLNRALGFFTSSNTQAVFFITRFDNRPILFRRKRNPCRKYRQNHLNN
jgi:hypothetical protein